MTESLSKPERNPRLPASVIVALAACALALAGAGCAGSQSALEPAGVAAHRIARLFWWMARAAAFIWIFLLALALHTLRVRPNPLNPRKAATLVIGGGVALPTVLLAILLAYGLNLLADLLAPPPESALRVHVIGEQWWWRVRYPAADDGPPVELANEIRVPVNEPVEFLLEAADVIHSFWIPSLGGKVDMIPGRRTRLVLQPTKVGRYRGICAEYCGGSHALMALDVVVEPADRFHAWLAAQAAPATAATSDSARHGEILFSRYGCAACHSIRGGGAGGAVGPDLTHFGSRLTVGASLLANDPANVARWISQCETLKPEAFMPSFDMIPDDDLRDLAAYLSELE